MNQYSRYYISEDEVTKMMLEMEQAERAGEFDGMFCKEQVVSSPSVSREELLQSIDPTMHLTKGFFMRIYGYEISYPGFSDQALSVLEEAGCSRAREYYNRFVQEYEKKHDEELKGVAHWYAQECEKQWEMKQKGSEQQRKQEQQKDQIVKDLERMSDGDLLRLWQQKKQQSREAF